MLSPAKQTKLPSKYYVYVNVSQPVAPNPFHRGHLSLSESKDIYTIIQNSSKISYEIAATIKFGWGGWAVVAQAFNPALGRQRQADLCEKKLLVMVGSPQHKELY